MKKRGVTLIEMILVMAILSIILASFYSVLISSTKTYNKASSFAKIQSQSVVIARLIENQLKTSDKVTIYEKVPSTFDKNLNYIYYNESEQKIYIKRMNENPKILFETKNVNQKVMFTGVDNKNISISVIIDAGTVDYENVFGVHFMNIPTADKINFIPTTVTSGICIEYKLEDAVEIIDVEPPMITSFEIKVDNNKDYEEFLITDSVATIDQENKVINVPPLTVVGDYKDVKLTPTIEYVDPYRGDKLKSKVNGNNSLFDTGSPSSIKFYENGKNNEVQFTVTTDANGVSDVTYTVNFEIKVEEKPVVFPTVDSLNIVATETGKPTKIVMPNTSDVLNADFKYTVKTDEVTPTGYKVRWYAVDPSEISSYSDFKTKYDDGKFNSFDVIENNSTLNASSYASQIAGKYVFYDVILTKDSYESSPFVSADENIAQNLASLKCPYVFVGLKNGKIYETTLNEINYIVSSQIQKDVMNICFNRISKANKQTYVGALFQSGVKDSYTQAEILNLIKVNIPSGNSGHKYSVDFVNKEVTITGASYQKYNSNNLYSSIASSETAHYGLLSLNMFDTYYSDCRPMRTSTNVYVSFKDDFSEMGGVSVVAGGKSILTTAKDRLYTNTYTYVIKTDDAKQMETDLLNTGGKIVFGDYSGSLDDILKINNYSISKSSNNNLISINTTSVLSALLGYNETIIGTWAKNYNGSTGTITITGLSAN